MFKSSRSCSPKLDGRTTTEYKFMTNDSLSNHQQYLIHAPCSLHIGNQPWCSNRLFFLCRGPTFIDAVALQWMKLYLHCRLLFEPPPIWFNVVGPGFDMRANSYNVSCCCKHNKMGRVFRSSCILLHFLLRTVPVLLYSVIIQCSLAWIDRK